ncbi:uncharacterized protein FA14DRAFT_158532 [Meira miltonrushii]|uniref:Glycoside hydrolase n=1 Tax=Meira miltonrushii TaxID=1280837 RepID=A0A316V3Y4_9BASI|nr:uncharacterized protein FA14DRAFT_158532 [Meira miltonrushii]PWN31718.1 hypothetical protein FA14DRAFT_158532 [Meira miltonrushii]
MIFNVFYQILLILVSLLLSLSKANDLVGEAVIDVCKRGKTATGQAGGILYGIPNDPAYSPDKAPTIPVDLQLGAGLTMVRAGGAQIPFPGFSSSIAGYEQRFESTLENYRSARAQNATFVLLPHDLWGADGKSPSTVRYPCDNGNCSFYGEFLDRLTGDLKKNNMTDGLKIDIWNEPDISLFWPGTQDQYLQSWSYAFRKYRSALGPSVPLQGPASSSLPALNNSWWTNYTTYLSLPQNCDVIPDVWSYHHLFGRYSPNCGNDPVDSRKSLSELLKKYNKLPNDIEVQVNEYGTYDGEQVPAYTAWFISRFERANITAGRANWGSGRGLHDDLARLLLPVNEGLGGWTTAGDWHVLNYYTKTQSGGRKLHNKSTKSKCYDTFATLHPKDRAIHILAGTRGQSGDYPIIINGLHTLGVSCVNASIHEIPSNNASTVISPNQVSNTQIYLNMYGSITVHLNMTTDSAYTIDLTY